MDRKKILLVIGFVVAVIVFGWLLYILFFQPSGPADVNVNDNVNGVLPQPISGNISVIENRNENVSLPDFGNTIDLTAPTDIARGGLTNVVDYGDQAVQDFTAGPGDAVFYNKDASQFFRLDGTRAVPLSDQKFFNVESVTWAQNLDKAIMEYPDGSNIIYDFTTERQITLPHELTDFSFNSNGESIAGKWFGDTDDENWLMVGDANGSNFQLVEPLGDRGHNVEVAHSPNDQVIALVREPVDANTQSVLPIGVYGENFKSFNVDGLKFESEWSPVGNALLYNVTTADNNYNPELWLTTGDTQTLGTSHLNLQLNTRAEKCAFSSSGTSIYCAESTNLPRGSGLYPELARGLPDAFFRIDLNSGQKIPLAIPVGSQTAYTAESVFLSGDESQLFFVDEITGRLHSIRLK